LRQLGLAALQYEGSHRKFSPGQIGPPLFQPFPPDGQYYGICAGTITFLLPYLEQNALGKQIQEHLDTKPEAAPWWTFNQLKAAASSPMPGLVCPSDAGMEPQLPYLVAMHAAMHENQWEMRYKIIAPPDWDGIPPSRTSYFGVAGYSGEVGIPSVDHWRGIFLNRTSISVKNVTDGLSHTFMFGECRCRQNNARMYNASWFCGPLPTCSGLTGNNWPQFGSGHTGVVNFAFADGAVHGISVDIDLENYHALSGIADGTVISQLLD
jgi:prepilin-type processing-associated H-X9-DG protein